MKSINEYLTPRNMAGEPRTQISKNSITGAKMDTDLLEQWLDTRTEEDEEEVAQTIVHCFLGYNYAQDEKEKKNPELIEKRKEAGLKRLQSLMGEMRRAVKDFHHMSI